MSGWFDLKDVKTPFSLFVVLLILLITLCGAVVTYKPAHQDIILMVIGGAFFCVLTIFLLILLRSPDLLFPAGLSDLENEQGRIKELTKELSGRMGMAERSLLPIISGENKESLFRLQKKELVVGSKEYPEQRILSHMLADMIESDPAITGVRCERLIPNGSTFKNFADLRFGWIDGYIEYTGTGWMLLQRSENGLSLEESVMALDHEFRKRYGIAWLEPIGCHNEYTLVMRRDISEKHGITRIGDLNRNRIYEKLNFCFTLEFFHRSDGLEPLCRKYGLKFRREIVAVIDERYKMLRKGVADLTTGFASDPEAASPDMVVLEDTDNFFPSYYAVPVIRMEALEKVEGLEERVRKLAHTVDNDIMTKKLQRFQAHRHGSAMARELAEDCLQGGP